MTEHLAGSQIIQPLIEHFRSARGVGELERLADDLGATGDPRAIDILIFRLSDAIVQDDADVRDAVCSALVRLNVMERFGNLNYRFLDDANLAPEAKSALAKYRQLIPRLLYK